MRKPSTPLRDVLKAYTNDLRKICALLNEWRRAEPEAYPEVVQLVERWQKSASLAIMLREDGALEADLCKVAVASFEPIGNGKGGSFVLTSKPAEFADARAKAVWLFASLVTNPLCERLAGRCPRCGKFWIARLAAKSLCCHRCRSRTASEEYACDTRRQEHERKLSCVRAAARRCKLRPGSAQWKQRVALRAGVSLGWLTKALKRDEL